MSKAVFFCREESYDFALEEITRLGGMKVKKLAPGAGLIESEEKDAAECVRLSEPLFVRHIHPADQILNDEGDLAAAAAGYVTRIPEKRVAVQSVDLSGKKRDRTLRFAILDSPAFEGFASGPEEDAVISVTATEEAVYLGFSHKNENITPRTAGVYRYAFDEGNISRAEFKLTEVFDTLDLSSVEGKEALDLGAAPGGWTRVLLGKGARVTAVDPAKLDPRIESLEDVTHYRGLSQDYLREHGDKRFAMLVNDMRMDARESVRVTLEALPMLDKGAWVVVTLKLPEKKSLHVAREALRILGEGVEIVYARQLYHNRSEITAVGRRR